MFVRRGRRWPRTSLGVHWLCVPLQADQSNVGLESSATCWSLVISGCWGWEVGSGFLQYALFFSYSNPVLLKVCGTFPRQMSQGGGGLWAHPHKTLGQCQSSWMTLSMYLLNVFFSAHPHFSYLPSICRYITGWQLNVWNLSQFYWCCKCKKVLNIKCWGCLCLIILVAWGMWLGTYWVVNSNIFTSSCCCTVFSFLQSWLIC